MAATAAAVAAQPIDRLRFVTYNVRRFTGADGSSTVAEVAAALRRLEPSFVCLNEVDLDKRPGALETVSRELGGFYIEFFGHVKGKAGFDKYGNALLSRYPPARSTRTHLEGGFESTYNGKPYRIHRGMLAAEFALFAVGGNKFPITVAVTHLDHISEPERRTQLAHVVRTLGDSEQSGGATVLMGDLNAMTRSDYTEDEWAAHEKRNADAGWEAPTTGCLRILEEAGYVDAFAQSALSQHEIPASTGLAEIDGLWRWSGHVDEPMYRIDYVWTKTAATGVYHLAVAGSFVATDVTDSDHYPVVADFDLVSTAGTAASEAQPVGTMKSDL